MADRFYDKFGIGTGANFFFRDFRNAYHYRPDQDPPRQQFNGYVNFILNRDLYAQLFADITDSELRTRLSSQVRTADMPTVEYETQTLNQYNRKKIVNTGVKYNPVTMKVVDSVSNSWLTLLMKYYTYHYMNARNKQYDQTDREIDNPNNIRIGGAETQSSSFKGETFKSNAYGYNPNLTSYFFERIDYVLYHGGKAVQYSLMNPVLTSFAHNQIDYSSNEPMEFDMTFEYENFTVYTELNEDMSEEGLDRFSDGSDDNDQTFNLAFLPGRKSIAGDTTVSLAQILGNDNNKRNRTNQPRIPADVGDGSEPQLAPFVSGNRDGVTTYNQNDSQPGSSGFSSNIFGEFLGDIADRAIATAINGGSVGDVVVEGLIEGAVAVVSTDQAQEAIADATGGLLGDPDDAADVLPENTTNINPPTQQTPPGL